MKYNIKVNDNLISCLLSSNRPIRLASASVRFSVKSRNKNLLGENKHSFHIVHSEVWTRFGQLDLIKMPKSCVAVNCTNHNLMGKDGLTFHIFPDREKKKEKFEKWVQAVKRINKDSSRWYPNGKYIYLCSEHFMEGKSS